MTRRFVAGLAAAALGVAFASPAAAQTLADRLAPAGLMLAGVSAPDDARLPVRLAYAHAADAQGADRARRAEVFLDVLVTDGPAEAARRAAFQAGTAAAGIPARPGIGDRGWGDRGMVVFARGRYVVEVRVVTGNHDALALARAADAVLQTPIAPSATPRMRIDPPQGGGPAKVRFEGDVVAAWVTASGDAYARRTSRGWVVTTTGAGAHEVDALAVTADLRVHALSSAP